MIHKLLGELFDGLLFFTGAVGVLIFFLVYWKTSINIRYAEVILQDFLWKVSVTGKITEDDYEGLQRTLDSIASKGDLKIKCIQYSEYPEYRMFTEKEMSTYFQSRNNRSSVVMEEYVLPVVHIREEDLKYQEETNDSFWAAEKMEYLSLPYEGSEVEIAAVCPEQEVYEGEKLITLCKVSSKDMNFYVEASEVIAKESGEIDLEVMIEETMYKIPIQVRCHPRTVQCNNGHTVLNDKRVIEEYKQSGTVLCTYCSMLPKKIFCEISGLNLKTGEKLTGEKIGVQVHYLDGSVEYVTPESEDWTDDYDEEFCGKQLVTIRYRNAETQIVVISENPPCIQCGNECNDRSKEDYKNYPFCIACLGKKYIFTGKVFSEEEVICENELEAAFEAEKEVVLTRGDYIVLEFDIGCYKTIVQKKILTDGTSGTKE